MFTQARHRGMRAGLEVCLTPDLPLFRMVRDAEDHIGGDYSTQDFLQIARAAKVLRLPLKSSTAERHWPPLIITRCTLDVVKHA